MSPKPEWQVIVDKLREQELADAERLRRKQDAAILVAERAMWVRLGYAETVWELAEQQRFIDAVAAYREAKNA